MKAFNLITIFLTITLMLSCSATSSLKPGEYLYTGSTIKFPEKSGQRPNRRIRKDLAYVPKPTPNKRVLGMPIKLWIYNSFPNLKKQKGFKYWIKTKLGEPPVIYKPEIAERNRLVIEKYIKDEGYLQGSVSFDTLPNGRKMSVEYTARGRGRYRTQKYHLPPDTTSLHHLLIDASAKTLVKESAVYQLVRLEAERRRLETIANNHGYYTFTKENIYFYLDTTVAKRELDVYMTIKPPETQDTFPIYRVGAVTIYPDDVLDRSAEESQNLDTVRQDYWTLVQEKEIVNLKTFKEAIHPDSSGLYSAQKENQTINHLLDFGVFKFVNLKYRLDTINQKLFLDRYFYLTPDLNQDVRVDVEATTESTNALGSAISFSYTHRNLFNGAERLNLSLSAGVEAQASQGATALNTYELSFNTSLRLPRLLSPFNFWGKQINSIPSTFINFNNNFQRRSGLFTLYNGKLEFGYSWKRSSRVQHQFYPASISRIAILQSTDSLETLLADNPRLKASLTDVFILGGRYRFIYNGQRLNSLHNFFYLSTELESAGNIPYVVSKLTSKKTDGKYGIFGAPFSQFMRLEVDGRYNMLYRKTSLVSRLLVGAGVPYGNAEVLPYVRQFFSGGASSIRAFRFRTVGPGGYQPDTSSNDQIFLDQVGDLKLEANLEYRFNMISYFKGAVFLDVGNVWLLTDPDNDQPNGDFQLNDFYRELAIGTGFGIRLDIDFFVIRLDIAFPLRDPSLLYDENPDTDPWRIKDIKFGSQGWRQDNLIWNIAIGYPF